MPMPLTDQQEQLSLAALFAVSAAAGFACERSDRIVDGMGIYATVSVDGPLTGGGPWHDPTMRFQVRATKKELSFDERGHSFSLDRTTYDRLRSVNRANPIFLAVYQMPREEDQWLTITTDTLVLRHRLRFGSLYGASEVETGSRTVQIPDANVLDAASLTELARVTSHGERIPYAADA